MAIGDLDEAVERLAYAITHEQDKRLSFLVGSGLSVPAAPSTAILCDAMFSELGMQVDRPERGTAREYRALADAMKRRRGSDGLPRLLRALIDPDPTGGETTPVTSSAWKLPAQQESLAQLIRLVPAHRRGPVFTTNFDPFVEVGLHRVLVNASAITMPGPSGVGLNAVVETVPVVHLHGYWTLGASLNTDAEIMARRPGVEDEVLRSIEGSIVVVLGYGGWDDAFTRTVEANLSNGRLATTGTEFIWIHHRSASANRAPFLSRVANSPQVIEYEEVEVPSLVTAVVNRIRTADLSRGPGVPGLWPVPRTSLSILPSREELVRFLDGAEPSDAVCYHAPQLTAAVKLQSAIVEQLPVMDDDLFIVAAGPTGEGKSVALRQVAARLAERDDLEVLSLRVGSPQLTANAVATLRLRTRRAVVVIDEADLVLDAIAYAVQTASADGHRLLFVCAMHSQYQDKIEYWRRNLGTWVLVEIDGIEQTDARSLAEYWQSSGLLPARFAAESPEKIAGMVWESATTDEGGSLYGSMLHLWDSDSLLDRARNTLARLAYRKVGTVTLADVLLGIALADSAWEKDEEPTGLTLAGLGEICSIDSDDVLSVVLAPLGREASLSRIGSTVLIRHPAVRDALLDTADDETDLRVAKMLGHAGGQLRRKGSPLTDCRPLVLLSRRLPRPLAMASARALVQSSGLLESRVSYLATCRDRGAADHGLAYARGLADHVAEFPDYSFAVRGFIVEWSIHELHAGEARKAAALCAYAICDAHPGNPTLRQVAYALMRLLASATQTADDQLIWSLENACAPLLSKIPSGETRGFRIPPDLVQRGHERGSSIHKAVADFALATRPLAGVLRVDGWSFRGLLRELAGTNRGAGAGS